jgi:hypothetical protein
MFMVVAVMDPAQHAHGKAVSYHGTLDEAKARAKQYTASWWKSVKLYQEHRVPDGTRVQFWLEEISLA